MKFARKNYSKEFKMEAIAMVKNGERFMYEVERQLRITSGLLSKWIAKVENEEKPEEVFPGNGKLTESDEKIRKLERENLRLRQEKEILKKCWKFTYASRSEVQNGNHTEKQIWCEVAV